MSNKIKYKANYDLYNKEFQTDYICIQGKAIELQRGKIEEVRPVYVEILEEANENMQKFTTSNLKISGEKPQVYNSI